MIMIIITDGRKAFALILFYSTASVIATGEWMVEKLVARAIEGHVAFKSD